MDNNFPVPPKDRRKEYTLSRKESQKVAEEDKQELFKKSSVSMLRQKHVEDMRNSLLSYKVLEDKKHYLPTNVKIDLKATNILLFGPSGSGKSSFIKTLFRALYCSAYLPPDAQDKLVVRDSLENEGTLNFTKFTLKEQVDDSTGIVVCDTRGHIAMNEFEQEQFKVLVDVSP